MENASKALFIAAGVIIAIMVISLGVYLFITFGQAASDTHEQVREYQLNQFNSQYTKYDKRSDLTIYDVVTVANMATKNNISNELTNANRGNDATYYIEVILDDAVLQSLGISGGANSRNIEKGFNEVIDSTEHTEGIIKNHVNAMIEKARAATIGRDFVMPKIKCDVKISEKTKRVFYVKFITTL